MLTELIELGHKMKEEMKATQSEIKQNIQGTNSDREETMTQINDLEQIPIQPEQSEETRIQKNEKRLGKLWDNFKCSNIWITGVPEGEEEEQEFEHLLEQIMKEVFPNLAKEIDVQEAQRVPKKLDPRREHQGTS